MNLTKLSLSYLKRRPLATALNVLLLALGVATIVVLLLFSHQFERSLTRNAEGFDVVVGAKGSPLQLILASIYHMDAPTGNIPLAEAQQLERNPAVAQAIPLALGDSYAGYRIVGTTTAYPEHYEAVLAEGAWWEAPYEVVVGAAVAQAQGLAVGSEIESAHGLSVGGEAHGEAPLRVVGVMAPSGTVIDRLVLTSVETVWAVHGTHGVEGEAAGVEGEAAGVEGEAAGVEGEAAGVEGEAAVDAGLPAADTAEGGAAEEVPPMPPMMRMPGAMPGGMPMMGGGAAQPELTALLVSYSSPMAAALFPRFVNSQTNLQAASPAFETARLLSLLGIGLDVLRAFAVVLILAAALGVFIALYNALKERQYDLAVMRTLGATQGKLLWHILLEGLLLAGMGAVLGLVLGHGAAAVLGAAVGEAQQMALDPWAFVPGELLLVALTLLVGLLAALLPALQAYRTDIARTLARA